MAIKKKVTYSVSYVAGTDTLTTQLNSLLQDIVTLILSQNTGLTVLDTITVGSERFTGAPLYDTYVSGLIPAADYNNRHYESDVIFIGTDEDNVCLSLGFFDGALVIAMNMSPKVEKDYTDVWSSQYGLTKLPFYATGVMSRWFTIGGSNTGTYALPYSIINDTISIGIIYWNGDYSRGYSFVNGAGQTDGVNLVIFPTDEGNNLTGIGFVVCPNTKITTYQQLPSDISIASFAENLSDNRAEVIPTGYYVNYEPNTPPTSIHLIPALISQLRGILGNLKHYSTVAHLGIDLNCLEPLGIFFNHILRQGSKAAVTQAHNNESAGTHIIDLSASIIQCPVQFQPHVSAFIIADQGNLVGKGIGGGNRAIHRSGQAI